MNCLVVVRVGEPSLWLTLKSTGRWSSPENHSQVVRNLIVEGYTVIALFVGRGDIPLAAVKVTNVRQRLIEDSIFPPQSDLGPLRTFMEFNPLTLINLEHGLTVTYDSALNHIRYKIGSQIHIPFNDARDFLNYFFSMATDPYRGNFTYIPNSNSINFVI